MLINSFSDVLRKHGIFPGVFCLSPDDGGGSGGTTVVDPPTDDPETDTDADEPKYTKEDVEKMALQRVKRLTKDSAAKDKKITDLEEQVNKLNEQITAKLNDPPSDPIPGADDPASEVELRKQQGHWEVQRTRYESQIKDLQTKLASSDKELTKVKQDRMSLERDLEIDKALSSPTVQCIDVDTARIIVRERVEWDPSEEEWIYKTKSGNILPVKEGIEAELPDYLRPSNLRQGGSGSTGGSPKAAAQRRKLDELRSQLTKIEEDIKKTPRNNDLLVRASKTRREIAQLEKTI